MLNKEDVSFIISTLIRAPNTLYALAMGYFFKLLMQQADTLISDQNDNSDVYFFALAYFIYAAQAEVMHSNDFLQLQRQDKLKSVMIALFVLFGSLNVVASIILPALSIYQDYHNGNSLDTESETVNSPMAMLLFYGLVTGIGSSAYLLLTSFLKYKFNKNIIYRTSNFDNNNSLQNFDFQNLMNYTSDNDTDIETNQNTDTIAEYFSQQYKKKNPAFSFFSSVESIVAYGATTAVCLALSELQNNDSYLGITIAAGFFALVFTAMFGQEACKRRGFRY